MCTRPHHSGHARLERRLIGRTGSLFRMYVNVAPMNLVVVSVLEAAKAVVGVSKAEVAVVAAATVS
eukprot:575998-Pleurochrysis_carterae.AAC.1